ncbi:MAG: DoxX family membrane protein [Bacteroidales bacterium]|jgi:uncharacterized membrane protein YphA (DoxX/SURF4 family)|nr:DoxX family membrane protein [Bacteroidales bacterium]
MERTRFLWKKFLFTALRVAIGWHFLYEGCVKLAAGSWSAEAYLAGTTGFMAPVYHWLAAAPVIGGINWLNIIGLILIGLALFMGCCVRLSAFVGAALLMLYYFAYPPFGLSLLSAARESHLFVVDPLLLEALTLLCIAVFRPEGYGVAGLVAYIRQQRPAAGAVADESGRRKALKDIAVFPLLGLFGWGAWHNARRYGVDVMSGATVQINRQELSKLKGELPCGKIGTHTISRLVLGGNLIGGWAHARDLLYADQLFKAYNNEHKIYETLMLAEAAGINTINIGFPSNALLQKYKKVTGSKIKVITQIAADVKEESTLFNNLYKAIDFGVDIIQIQGNWCDWMVRDRHVDRIGRLLAKIRDEGYTAGLGAHTIDSLIACRDAGIIPDYYMKTMHHDRYWSAHPRENRVPFETDGANHLDHNKYHNNLFCPFPERVTEFVSQATVPVMGFKVLAAGAIPPEDGFQWAFVNGADFICVGMFDFQIVRDVNICLDVLAAIGQNHSRSRAWAG